MDLLELIYFLDLDCKFSNNYLHPPKMVRDKIVMEDRNKDLKYSERDKV
jgi:hypothetical protein